jgi:DNA-binding NarL/FixJ family response regulator
VTRYKGSDSVETLRARLHKVPIGYQDDFGQERTGGVLQRAISTTPRAGVALPEQVAALHAQGLGEQKIADQLGISRHQVRKHLNQDQPGLN